MSKTSKTVKFNNYNIKVYADADHIVEQILLRSVQDFKRIIEQESQKAKISVDPNVFYDQATRTLVIEQFPQDKGTVMVVEDKKLVSVPYNKVSNDCNYAHLDPTKGCYCVYVKRSKGADDIVNVALGEDLLLDVFDTVTSETLAKEKEAADKAEQESIRRALENGIKEAEAEIAEKADMKVSE
jgi:hypothetical protein